MKIGYIIASREVAKGGKRVGYMYRERPNNGLDSGWRVFSGEEDQEYADEATNFAMYNASTIVALDPTIRTLLASEHPIAFEREPDSDEFVRVEPPEIDEEEE